MALLAMAVHSHYRLDGRRWRVVAFHMQIVGAMRDQLAVCIAEPEVAHTLPAWCYVDPHVYELEQSTLFRNGWVGVGRSDRWPNAGDYSAIDIGGVPVVIVRDEDGALRSYANTCMHRSAQILSLIHI